MSHALNTFIDHTLLKPEASAAEIKKICEETIQFQFVGVCVAPVWVAYARTLLPKSLKVISVVGFPLGANTTETKVFEARQLVEQGANELDMVIHIGALKSKDFALVKQDIQAVAKATSPALLKVIIETCLLTDEEKRMAALLCMEGGAHFVKTSTGFSKSGATFEDVAFLRRVVGPHFGVKAAGGIRDRAAAIAMIEAGANRIGTSASVSIMENIHPKKSS